VRPAVLTIEIDEVHAGAAIRLCGPAVHGWSEADRLLGRVRPGTPSNELLHGDLVRMKDAVRHQGTPDWDKTGAALKGLITAGGIHWHDLLGRLRAPLAERLGEALRPYAFHPGEDIDPRQQAENAPVIEVKAPPSLLLPIDVHRFG
jgi:hypothetical protein